MRFLRILDTTWRCVRCLLVPGAGVTVAARALSWCSSCGVRCTWCRCLAFGVCLLCPIGCRWPGVCCGAYTVGCGLRSVGGVCLRLSRCHGCRCSGQFYTFDRVQVSRLALSLKSALFSACMRLFYIWAVLVFCK